MKGNDQEEERGTSRHSSMPEARRVTLLPSGRSLSWLTWEQDQPVRMTGFQSESGRLRTEILRRED